MPLQYEIDAGSSHVSILATGEVTMAGMIAIVEQVAKAPGFQSRFTVTLDLRGVDYAAELTDGDALAAILRQKKPDFQNRFAVVVSDSLYFLGRLYCVLAIVGGFDKIRCFTDKDQALAWCQADK